MNILFVQMEARKARRDQVQRVVAHLDYKKAFDSTSHKTLTALYAAIGLSAFLLAWIAKAIKGSTFVLVGMYYFEVAIQRISGLCQGDPFSAVAFVFLMEYFCSWLRANLRWAPRVTGYADDTNLILDSWDQVRELFSLLESTQIFFGLQINFKKTVIQVIGPHARWKAQAPLDVQHHVETIANCEGKMEEIPATETFRFLEALVIPPTRSVKHLGVLVGSWVSSENCYGLVIDKIQTALQRARAVATSLRQRVVLCNYWMAAIYNHTACIYFMSDQVHSTIRRMFMQMLGGKRWKIDEEKATKEARVVYTNVALDQLCLHHVEGGLSLRHPKVSAAVQLIKYYRLALQHPLLTPGSEEEWSYLKQKHGFAGRPEEVQLTTKLKLDKDTMISHYIKAINVVSPGAFPHTIDDISQFMALLLFFSPWFVNSFHFLK